MLPFPTFQVHNDKPSLWIEAAKWEFENEGSAENARKILLRGLRLVGHNLEIFQ